MTSDPIISKNNVNTSTSSLNHRKNHQRSIDLSSSSSSSTSYHSFSSLSSSSPSPSSPSPSSPSPSSPFLTPSTSTSATTTYHYHRHHLNNLPSDPKNWTSKDVSEYLYYCLQSFTSQYQQKVILELTNYIKQDTVNFSGRKFLRLKEEQLKQMRFGGNDDDWINLIMIGVKSLRRETLKEKILLKNDNNNNNNNKQHDVNNEQKGYFDYFFDDDGDYNNEENDSNKNDDGLKKEKEKHANDENKSIKRSYYSNGFLQGLIIGGIIMFAFMRIK